MRHCSTSRFGACVLITAVLSASAIMACSGQTSTRSAGSLPLVEVPADSGHIMALFLTGDGGWASGDRALAQTLARGGVAVVGMDSRAYLRGARRTPETTALDAERIVDEYATRWHRDRLILVGYSRGADMAPFIVSRWPAALRSRLALVALVGLADHTSFEFHWQDLVHDSRRASDLLTRPELERIRGAHILCIYGEDETGSLCPSLDPALARSARIGGGHVLGAVPGAAAGALILGAMR